MPVETQTYLLIEDAAGMKQFEEENKEISWLCFDTEFVGEKRFVTALCLIQIATEHGFYLIDTIKVKDISAFIKMVTDENIIKVAHAGENDYRLLNTHYGIVPKNTFDAQIAAGFAGYKYPVSFRRLVESELNLRLSKGYTVTDWEQRPFQKRQLKYALSDVTPLYELWQELSRKLKKLGRLDWALDECKELENPAFYDQDPHKEAFNSNIIKNIAPREQLFLIRLYRWRTEEARRKNFSKEMVMPGKLISQIIRGVSSGKEALLHNRRLPDNLIHRYGDIFVDLYKRSPSEEEKGILEKIPRDNSDNPQQDLMMEMLHLLVRHKCLKENIAYSLVMPRTYLKKMKADKDFFESRLENGWRRKFLGEELTHWLKNRTQMEIVVGNGKFEVKMKED